MSEKKTKCEMILIMEYRDIRHYGDRPPKDQKNTFYVEKRLYEGILNVLAGGIHMDPGTTQELLRTIDKAMNKSK